MHRLSFILLTTALIVASVISEENVDISKIKEMLHRTRADQSAEWAAANLIDTIKIPGEYVLAKYKLEKIATDTDQSNLYTLNLSIKINGTDGKITEKTCNVEISDNPLFNSRFFKSAPTCS